MSCHLIYQTLMNSSQHYLKPPKAFTLPEKVNPIHVRDLIRINSLPWSHSPGLPYREQGLKTKREAFELNLDSIRSRIHNAKRTASIEFEDSLAFFRSHLVNIKVDPTKNKIRAVCAYPLDVYVIEAMFGVPLLEAFKKKGYPTAYDFEIMFGAFNRLRTISGTIWICLDWSKFDKRIWSTIIKLCFEILLWNLDLTKYHHHGTPDAYQLIILYDLIVEYLIRTPIRLPNGKRYRKSSGVPSGSLFIQWVIQVGTSSPLLRHGL